MKARSLLILSLGADGISLNCTTALSCSRQLTTYSLGIPTVVASSPDYHHHFKIFLRRPIGNMTMSSLLMEGFPKQQL